MVVIQNELHFKWLYTREKRFSTSKGKRVDDLSPQHISQLAKYVSLKKYILKNEKIKYKGSLFIEYGPIRN